MAKLVAFFRRLTNTLDAGSSLYEIVFALITVIGTTSAARYTFWEEQPSREEIVSATILVIIAWSVIDAAFTLLGEAFQIGRHRLAARQSGAPIPPLRFTRESWWTAIASFCATSVAMWPALIPFALPIGDKPVLWISNAIAILTLWWVGWFWARWTDFRRWRFGLLLAGVGVAAVAVTLLLGVA